jgi:hypothetical protein
LRSAAHRLHGTLAAFSTVAGALALTLEGAAERKDAARSREVVLRLEQMAIELVEEARTLTFEALIA